MHLTSLILTSFLATSPTLVSASKPKDAILLSKVKSLTLHNGRQTSHRRVGAVPQLSCVGGSAKGLYDVDVMRCVNGGAEYETEDIAWTCKADLPREFKLGATDVICEGYSSSDDPYVLKGSCGVEYRLLLTDAGLEKYPERSGTARMDDEGRSTSSSSTGRWFELIFWLAFACIVIAIISSIYLSNTGRGNGGGQTGGRYHGGGGGGGGDDGPGGWDDPPPPYTRHTQSKFRSAYPNRASSSRAPNNQQQRGFRPGFWTGAGTGAAAGYAAGAYNASRNSGSADRQQQRNGSNWGSSGDSYSSSGGRHESTGFGGTSRR